MLDLTLTAALLGLAVEALPLDAPQIAVATRTSQPPTIDGNLSDPVWAQVVPITDFTQQAPDEGEKPIQKTGVRILYDDQSIYFDIRCFDTDPKTIVANMTRRPHSRPASPCIEKSRPVPAGCDSMKDPSIASRW